MTNSKYMVLDLISGTDALACNLTLEQAAHMLLTADGHAYETRENDGFVELWHSLFSGNSPMGAQYMVKCNALARTESELWQWVVDSHFDWGGLTACPQRRYQVMLDSMENGEVRSDPRGDAFDTLENAISFAHQLGKGAWIDVRDADGRYFEHYESEDLDIEPIEREEN